MTRSVPSDWQADCAEEREAAAGAGTIALQQIAQQMSLSGSAQKVVPVAPEWPAQTCRGR